MALLEIDPKNLKVIRELAGYLGTPSIVPVWIKGKKRKGIARMGLWIEKEDGEPYQWTYDEVKAPSVLICAVWSWLDKRGNPTPAEGIAFLGDEIIGFLSPYDGWHRYDSQRDMWIISGYPVFLENMTRFLGKDGIDIDVSDVVNFMATRGFSI